MHEDQISSHPLSSIIIFFYHISSNPLSSSSTESCRFWWRCRYHRCVPTKDEDTRRENHFCADPFRSLTLFKIVLCHHASQIVKLLLETCVDGSIRTFDIRISRYVTFIDLIICTVCYMR